MSRRYQAGCLYRERRKAGPDIWVFRYRGGTATGKSGSEPSERFPNRRTALPGLRITPRKHQPGNIFAAHRERTYFPLRTQRTFARQHEGQQHAENVRVLYQDLDHSRVG